MNNSLNLVLVHGSWHGGWCWKKVERELNSSDYRIFTPTLLGMESKNDPLAKNTGLTLHVEQISKLILENNLSDIVLVGHSYAGMVITGVAHKIPEKISKLIYLDAFLPDNNQSLFDLSEKERVETMEKSLEDNEGRTIGQGAEEVWLLPIRDPKFFGVNNQEDIKYLQENMVPTPVLTFREKVKADNPLAKSIEKYYIRCTQNSLSEKFGLKAKNTGYNYYEIDAGHDVMISEPVKFIDTLIKIIK